jgi:hypothetical protein
VLKSLSRLFILDPAGDRTRRDLVFRARDAIGIEATWEKRILALGDGRSVHDIIQALYEVELDRGAGLADIGVWRSLFDRSVVATIGDLENRGYIRIKAVSMEKYPGEMSTSPNGTGMRDGDGSVTPGRTAEVPTGQWAQIQGSLDSPDEAATGQLVMAQAWTSREIEGRRTEAAPRPGVPGNIFYERLTAPIRMSFTVEVFQVLARAGRRGLGAVDGLLDRTAGLGRR